jgi:protein TonB
MRRLPVLVSIALVLLALSPAGAWADERQTGTMSRPHPRPPRPIARPHPVIPCCLGGGYFPPAPAPVIVIPPPPIYVVVPSPPSLGYVPTPRPEPAPGSRCPPVAGRAMATGWTTLTSGSGSAPPSAEPTYRSGWTPELRSASKSLRLELTYLGKPEFFP